MKKIGFAVLVSLIALCASVPVFAGTGAPFLVAELTQSNAPESCPAPQGALFLATSKEEPVLNKALCSATANCASGTVSCNGNNSATSCAAYDRNCATGEQGHVTCDGVTTWCPTVACGCTTGTIRQRACCRCAQTEDCWDCYLCAHGFFSPDAC